MRFTKMQGLGNDYVYVNCFDEQVDDPPALSKAVSDRHRGIGSDGLILICPSQRADVRMEMYNADGSRGLMCGNGIRCVAKYAIEHGLAAGPIVRVESDSGVKDIVCEVRDGLVRSARVDMGEPSFSPAALPSTIDADPIRDYPLQVDGRTLEITCVSMGNPHAVVFVDDVHRFDLARFGPALERHSAFPQRINAHFVQVDSPEHLTMRTWERGSGATQACGTGACAVVVAAAMTERSRRRVTATLPGGDLKLDWADNNHVFKTGPAVEVFSGDWPG
ncbi:MAG: diaminopimelate epimerase [Phycisphaerales bacterium]|nr:MAG: diaminopimelate epimerase [Phycisphaerales bacterium]